MDGLFACLFWLAAPVTGIGGLFILLRVATNARPDGRHCTNCGYDLEGLERGLPCPECGGATVVPDESFCRRCNRDLSEIEPGRRCPGCGFNKRGARLPPPDQAIILAAIIPGAIAFLVVLITALSVAGGSFWFDAICIAPPFLVFPLVLVGVGRGLTWKQILAVSICMNLFGAASGMLGIIDGFVWHPDALSGLIIMFMTVVAGVGMGIGLLIGATGLWLHARLKAD